MAGQSSTVWSCHLGLKQPSITDTFSNPKASSATKPPSFDTSDSEAEAPVMAKKAKAAPKRKQADSDDSDSDLGNLMSRLKSNAVGSKASVTTGLRSELAHKGPLWRQIAADPVLSFRKPRSASVTKPSTFLTRKHPLSCRHATTPLVHANPLTTAWTRMKTFKECLFSFFILVRSLKKKTAFTVKLVGFFRPAFTRQQFFANHFLN